MRVYTGGTFDLFHHGHVRFLRECAQFGKVTVALNDDNFIFRFKNKYPIMNYYERSLVLESCKYVDEVIQNDKGEDSGYTIDQVKPDIIAIGTDWLSKDYLGQLGIDEQFLRERNIKLLYIPYTESISSTEIRKRLEAGYSDTASD